MDVVFEHFVEGFGEFFYLAYVFGGHAEEPVVGSVYEVAVFEVDVHFLHFFSEFSCGDDIKSFVGNVLGCAFDEDVVAVVVEGFVFDYGVVAPDDFLVFESFHDAPDFLA